MPTTGFYPKSENIGQMCILCIVKLESGGQQLLVIKKNLSGNSFKLENCLFLLKVLKTYDFTQITECSIIKHLHCLELRSRA